MANGYDKVLPNLRFHINPRFVIMIGIVKNASMKIGNAAEAFSFKVESASMIHCTCTIGIQHSINIHY